MDYLGLSYIVLRLFPAPAWLAQWLRARKRKKLLCEARTPFERLGILLVEIDGRPD